MNELEAVRVQSVPSSLYDSGGTDAKYSTLPRKDTEPDAITAYIVAGLVGMACVLCRWQWGSG